jgi:hypothetical protein
VLTWQATRRMMRSVGYTVVNAGFLPSSPGWLSSPA